MAGNNFLHSAQIEISTAFDASQASRNCSKLVNEVNKTAQQIRSERLKELDLLFKEGKLSEEQLAKLRRSVDNNNFLTELNQEKRLFALRLKNEKELEKTKKKSGFVQGLTNKFKFVESASNNPGGAALGAVSMIPGGVAVAAGFTALAATLGAVNKKFIGITADFEHELNTIQAVSGATAEERRSYSGVIAGLGASTAWSASDVAKGYESLVRAGLSIDSANLVIKGAADLATAQNVTIENAGELLTTTANQYGLTALDSSRISDVVSTALSGSAQDMADFSEALKYCGQGLNSVGVELESSTALIMQLADVSVKGSSAGNALKNLANRLNSNKDKLKEFGIEVETAGGAFKPIEQILADIKEKTSSLSDVDRASFFKDIFGSNFSNPIQALANNAEKVAEKIGQLREADGATARAVATMGTGVSAQFKNIGSKLESLIIKIGETLGPLTNVFLSSVEEAVKGFREGIEPFLDQIKASLTNIFSGINGESISESLGKISGYLLGNAASFFVKTLEIGLDLIGGVNEIIRLLMKLPKFAGGGIFLETSKKAEEKALEDYNEKERKAQEAQDRYRSVKKDSNATPEEKRAAAGAYYQALQALDAAVQTYLKNLDHYKKRLSDKYQKKDGSWKKLSKELEEERDVYIPKNAAAGLRAFEFIQKELNDKELLRMAFQSIKGGYIGLDSGDEDTETQEETAAAPSGLTEEQQKKLNEYNTQVLANRMKEALERGLIDQESQKKYEEDKNAVEEGNKSLDEFLNFWQNELDILEKIESLQKETNDKMAGEYSKLASALGLNLTAEQLGGYLSALEKGDFAGVLSSFGDLKSQAAKESRVVTSAFSEINYKSDYATKADSIINSLNVIRATLGAIKQNTADDKIETTEI